LLTFTDTTIIDRYTTDVTLPATDHTRGLHVTHVTVEIGPVDGEPDSLYCDVIPKGYELTAKGTHNQRFGYGRLFSTYQSEGLYNVAREALLASIERHGLDAARFDPIPFPTLTFAEYQARLNERHSTR
jgi:hypothetical protein